MVMMKGCCDDNNEGYSDKDDSGVTEGLTMAFSVQAMNQRQRSSWLFAWTRSTSTLSMTSYRPSSSLRDCAISSIQFV